MNILFMCVFTCAFSYFLIYDPLTPPPPNSPLRHTRLIFIWPASPWGLEELIVLAYVHSQMDQHMCAKFVTNWCTHLVVIPDF